MKIVLLTTMLLMTSISQAEVMNMVCTTAKGTELKLNYDNWSKSSNKPELISLSIGGNDLKSQLVGQFGTSGGKPTFTIANFPKAGQKTEFSLWGPNSTYYVNGQANPINCSAKPAVAKAVVDNSF